MELPDDTPRLPKLPFIVGDLILLSIAAMLAFRMGSSPSTAEVVGIVVSTGLAVAVGLAPFVIGYARQQEVALRERERMLEKLVRSTASAADQASIAANGLNEIVEKTKTNLDRLDSLPDTIRAARQAAESEATQTQNGDLEKLRADLAAVKDELVAKNDSLGKRLDAALTALGNSLQTTVSALEPKAEPVAAPAPRAPRRKKAAAPETPANDDLLFGGDIIAVGLPDIDEGPAEEELAKPKRKRKSKKSAPAATVEPAESPVSTTDTAADDDTSDTKADATEPESPTKVEKEEASPEAIAPQETEDESSSPRAAIEEEPAPESPPGDEPTDSTEQAEELSLAEPTEPEATDTLDEVVSEEPAPEEPALSSDGMTRLTVTAYIGIGNRLFIRGEGPGLNREEGIPLQFVSIGKWRWESDAANEPVKVTLWKNDEEECTSAGEITLKPGAQVETAANF